MNACQTTETDQNQDEREMVPLALAAFCAVEREREQPRSRHERLFILSVLERISGDSKDPDCVVASLRSHSFPHALSAVLTCSKEYHNQITRFGLPGRRSQKLNVTS